VLCRKVVLKGAFSASHALNAPFIASHAPCAPFSTLAIYDVGVAVALS
jgi:hypothetical protein